jgi:FkbM family methyltransferase
VVPLPWGISMEVDPRETIGRPLCNHGLFEIAVVEALFRLINPGDLVLDIGANIGFMSAAAAASQAGVVIAFEPHPVLFERLARNVAAWSTQRLDMQGRLRAQQVAISDSKGQATLHIPDAFAGNQGIASLVDCAPTASVTSVSVRCVTIGRSWLLDLLPGQAALGAVDVHGREQRPCGFDHLRLTQLPGHAGSNASRDTHGRVGLSLRRLTTTRSMFRGWR